MSNSTHFFLGANSGHGFQSLFEKFCDEKLLHDLLVLKGGPGCGKSTMMRKIGEVMEERGEMVEYLHCSGDPSSLDGVFIPRLRVAAVDGTSPHVLEPRYPAAVGRYVDLGRFYRVEQAKTMRDKILEKSNAYKRAYASAYQLLGAAQKLQDEISAQLLRGFDFDKLHRRTAGIIKREIRGNGGGGADQWRFLGSLTCCGEVSRLDSVERLCPRVYCLLDSCGAAAVMLEEILSALHNHGYRAILCPDAEHMERLSHLLIPELGVAFLTVKDPEKSPCLPFRRIHLDAMSDPAHRKNLKGKLKLMRKIIETLREEAVDYLREAKAQHDALEQLYIPYIDFEGIDLLTKQEIERISAY